MSLTTTLRTASSGLQAAQASLRAVSDNIANVNTPGYVRKAVDQQPLVVNGVGQGVRIDGVRRITDQYLQLASLSAASDSERWSAVSQYLDNAQSLFGDPGGEGYFFSRLDKIFAAFATAADDPSSTLLKSQALGNVEDFLSEAGRINSQIVSLGDTVETRITAGVDRANHLLEQIALLNSDIKRATLVNADASGSENIQSQLLDELAGLMNVRISPRATGGADVRSLEGVLLAGDLPARLTYVSSDSTPGYITARPVNSTNEQPIQMLSGELRGLMQLRDEDLPKIYDQLGEFVSKAVDQINAAHNDATAFPPPTSLAGRDTGFDLPTAVSNFTGTTTLAVVNTAGALQRSVAINFTAGTISVNGGAATAFTPANFLGSLNTALAGVGSAAFSNGALTLNATAGNGLALDEGTSDKAGRGFSHYFGLNDLIDTTGFANYATGLTGTDPHGFTPGGQISLRLSHPDGRPIRDLTVTAPAGATMNDLITALNNNATGVGLYGAFSLDSDGVLAFGGSPPLQARLSVVIDNTQRGATGPSISQLFGLGVRERSGRAGRFEVAQALNSDPNKVAMGKLDLTAAVGQIAVRPGDGQGGLALSTIGEVATRFQAAGALGKVTMNLSRYAAELGGAVGRGAAAAETRKSSAESVFREATNRRQSVEGVNIDEELINLTTYQQAFNASARMVQAASDLFEVLVNMV